MKNILGNNVTLTVFGESHGSKIGVVIDGLCAGIKVDNDYIKKCLSFRRPQGKIETSRIEKDEYEIVSGVFNSYTTGTPLCILIDNTNIKSKDYDKIKNLARPSHADYVSHIKYHGFEDYRGGGHFSGRITAPIVAGGAIILKALERLNIKISTHIKQCGKVKDVNFNDFDNEVSLLENMDFPVITNVKELMENEILNANKNNDSVGGIIQTAIVGLPVGIGEPMFDSLEGMLSKALFGIGAIKGIEFGLGFNFADKIGSEVNDEFYIDENKNVRTKTNNNGGINGGISNGMPIVFNCAIKPTPSIAKKQSTINIETLENEEILIEGRHDPAIIRRINIVIKAVTALVIADALVLKYGTDVFLKDSL